MSEIAPGKKTYILGVVSIAWGLASAWFPDLGPLPMTEDPMMMILGGATAMGLRKGIG